MTTATKLLEERHVAFEPLPHAEAHTAIGEALMLHAQPREVVKPVVVMGAAGPALMVVPATRRLDMRLVCEVLDDPHAHLATEREITRLMPEFELGAIAPLPRLVGMPVYVDPEVMELEEVVIASGTATMSLRAAPGAIFGEDAAR